MRNTLLVSVALFAAVGCAQKLDDGEKAETTQTKLTSSQVQWFLDPSGVTETYAAAGSVDLSNPFFQKLGTNDRTCGTCHRAGEGWTISADGVKERFDETDGTDPLFMPHDAATSPKADVSTVDARREAYKLLLDRAVIRIGIGVPAGAEFELSNVDDPYGFASSTQLSLFRRPLPTTNLAFATTVSWDARMTLPNQPIAVDLATQANGANTKHAQSTTPLTDEQKAAIVAFETSIYTAQRWDWDAGSLRGAGGLGGAITLASTTPTAGAGFALYDAWSALDDERAAVARGQAAFNVRCAGCHDSGNVGNHSAVMLADIGVASAARRRSDVPLYTLRNLATGEEIQTTDPGRALITGKWADVSRFKVPALRGLAARAPYFHDGSAATLEEVIEHYDDHFQMNLSDGEKKDLASFLRAL